MEQAPSLQTFPVAAALDFKEVLSLILSQLPRTEARQSSPSLSSGLVTALGIARFDSRLRRDVIFPWSPSIPQDKYSMVH